MNQNLLSFKNLKELREELDSLFQHIKDREIPLQSDHTSVHMTMRFNGMWKPYNHIFIITSD